MQRVSTNPPSDLVELGRVCAAYGVRGWVKIEPHSAQADVLLSAREWWLRSRHDNSIQSRRVLTVRPHGATLVAQLEGILTREQAAEWRGSAVLVPRSEFPPLPDNEYYWVDLIGALVYGVTGGSGDTPGVRSTIAPASADSAAAKAEGEPVLLGRVAHVSDNGAHAILHVRRLRERPTSQAAARETSADEEILVPFVAAHILQVDLPARRILTNWPDDF